MMSNPSARPALCRVKRNDPILTHLLVCEPPTAVIREGPHFDLIHIKDDGPALGRICDAIGRNKHLVDVCFDAPTGLSDLVAQYAHFEGLRKNASIRSLGLSRCDLNHGVGREVLRAFEENHAHLTKFALWRCTVHYRGPDYLAASLAKCTRLTEVSLSSCRIDDAVVEKLAEAIKGHHELKTLDLQKNHIRRGGCQALATLLKDPKCNLVDMDLQNNMIDDCGAKAMADALAHNTKLEVLCLDENYISAEGWNAYVHILCDKSSIDATHSSNHVLRTITSYGRIKARGVRMHDEDGVIPPRLFELLECNERVLGGHPARHGARVARRKILDAHFRADFDMGPFAEGNMDRELLPHVLGWLARPRRTRGGGGEATGRTAAYELLRQTPTLCDMSCRVKGFVGEADACASGVETARGVRDDGGSAKRRSRLGSVLRSANRPRPFKKWRMPNLWTIRLVVGVSAVLVL